MIMTRCRHCTIICLSQTRPARQTSNLLCWHGLHIAQCTGGAKGQCRHCVVISAVTTIDNNIGDLTDGQRYRYGAAQSTTTNSRKY